MVGRWSDMDSSISVPRWDFITVPLAHLQHPMFRGRMDWIGAWILVQAAADGQTNRVNLTDVGRQADRDYGWDNDKWRRFVKRLERESFIATIEKKNFGNNIGHVHIAMIVERTNGTSSSGSNIGELAGAALVPNAHANARSRDLMTSDDASGAGAQVSTEKNLDDLESNREVWLVVDDGEDEGLL